MEISHPYAAQAADVVAVISPSYACAGALARPETFHARDGRAWPRAPELPRKEAEEASRHGFASGHFSKRESPDAARGASIDALDMLRETEAALAPFATTSRAGDPRAPHGHRLPIARKLKPQPARYLEDVFRARARVDTGPFRRWAAAHVDEGMYDEAWLRANNAWMTGRDSFMNQFKPNVTALILQFGTADTKTIFRYPAYTDALQRDVISPLLEAVGVNESRVTRLQLAHMPPRSQIRPHVDAGFWAESQHRVHVPLIVPRGLAFMSFIDGAFRRVPVETGLAFEINNKIPHCVYNTGDAPRLHLLVDELTHDPPAKVHVLAKGTVCNYNTAADEKLPDSCVNRAVSTYDPVARAAELRDGRRRRRRSRTRRRRE